jgi:hypothetical protein
VNRIATPSPLPLEEEVSDSRRAARLVWGRRLLVAIVITGLAMTLVSLYVSEFRALSPYDEFAHIDYVDKISHGRIVRRGDAVGQQALHQLFCRGVAGFTVEDVACTSPGSYDPGLSPFRGVNTADVHPPLYYLLTSWAGRGITAVTGVNDFVDGARLVGGFWLGLGLIALWHAARSLRISIGNRLSIAALVATSPIVLLGSATVNPDASAILAGGAVLLAVVLWEENRTPSWVLGVVAAVAIALKVTNALACLAAALYLLFRLNGVRSRRLGRGEPARSVREYLGGIATVLATSLLVILAWTLIRAAVAITTSNVQIESLRVERLSLEIVLSHADHFMTPLSGSLLAALDSPATVFVLALLEGVIIAVCFGAVFRGNEMDRSRALALTGAVVMLVGATLLIVSGYLLNSGLALVQPRYGLSFVPFLMAAVGSSVRNRVGVWVLGVLAAGSTVLVFVLLIGE